MTNPVLQETIIRSMEDVPEQLRNVYSKEILKAFFEKDNYLIMRIVPSGDTRFYLDSGKRVTSAMDFLKPLQKQGVYFEGYSVSGGQEIQNQAAVSRPGNRIHHDRGSLHIVRQGIDDGFLCCRISFDH